MPTTRTCRLPGCRTPDRDVREIYYRVPGDGVAADPIREVEYCTYLCLTCRQVAASGRATPIRARIEGAWREAYKSAKGVVFNAQVAREWAVAAGILPPTITKTGRVPEAIITAYAEMN